MYHLNTKPLVQGCSVKSLVRSFIIIFKIDCCLSRLQKGGRRLPWQLRILQSNSTSGLQLFRFLKRFVDVV